MDNPGTADGPFIFRPSDETCVKCSETRNLHKYDGELYCKAHLNQMLEMQ